MVNNLCLIGNNKKTIVRNYDSDNQCTLSYLQEHYSSVGHAGFSRHVSVTFINKMHLTDSLKRKHS